MGYRISTLKNLPKHHNFYFILIGDYSVNDRINDLFRNNFNYLADNVSNSGIVQRTEDQALEQEIYRSVGSLIHNKSELGNLIRSIESHMPGLLITDKHPSELDESSLIIFITFSKLSKIYKNNNDLVQDLIALSEGKNKNIIEKVNNKGFLTKLKDALILEPNIHGFGINLKKLS